MNVDIAVVGAGVMGACTARELARSGLDVALFEQFHVGHKRGSSHGRSRIFRLSYPDPMYVAMARDALELWRALERDAESELMITTGGIDAGPGIDANARALVDHGVAFEEMSGEDASARWPFLALPPDDPVLYQPDGGIVLADDTVAAATRLAVEGGVQLHENTRVDRLERAGDAIALRTAHGTVNADVVVVTAGGWARALLNQIDIDIPTRPTRETVAYFSFDAATPPAVVHWGEPAIYALASPGQGIKAGEHIAGPTTEPDDDGRPNEDSVARVAAWIARLVPGADPRPHFAETCIYTNTPDEHFILERRGNVVIGSPCSGHGFKFAPLIGKRLADLALDPSAPTSA